MRLGQAGARNPRPRAVEHRLPLSVQLAFHPFAHEARPRSHEHILPHRPSRLLRVYGGCQKSRQWRWRRGRRPAGHRLERQPRTRRAGCGQYRGRLLHGSAGVWRLRAEQSQRVYRWPNANEQHHPQSHFPPLRPLHAPLLLLPPRKLLSLPRPLYPLLPPSTQPTNPHHLPPNRKPSSPP